MKIDIQYLMSNMGIYPCGIYSTHPMPSRSGPRAAPSIGWSGVNPLWVYFQIGYRIFDISLYVYIYTNTYFLHIYVYIYIYMGLSNYLADSQSFTTVVFMQLILHDSKAYKTAGWLAQRFAFQFKFEFVSSRC